MKRLLLCCLVLAPVAACSSKGAKDKGGKVGGNNVAKDVEWKELALQEPPITVLMPGIPEARLIGGPNPNGDWTVDRGPVWFTLRYRTLPRFGAWDDPEKEVEVMDTLADLAPVEDNRELAESRNEIKVGGVTGREIEMSMANNKYRRLRMFLINRKFFVQMAVTGTREQTRSADANKFLDSLKVTAEKKNDEKADE